MKLLISGVCGFVGSTLAKQAVQKGHEVIGIDNLSRKGSETNVVPLKALGVEVLEGDVRDPAILKQVGTTDAVVDASANASVLAGVDGISQPTDLIGSNFNTTVALLEYCKEHSRRFIFLSSSRVYSIGTLRALPLDHEGERYQLDHKRAIPTGITSQGINEAFSTAAPISLYGASKLCSETMAMEYGQLYNFPVWINRCGLLAGKGQFGTADQGIVSYWIESYKNKKDLKYLGFEGKGYQVRDCLHPEDLYGLIEIQLAQDPIDGDCIFNVSGGLERSFSLKELSDWCAKQFGPHTPEQDGSDRTFDIPWCVLDNFQVRKELRWQPQWTLEGIWNDIAGL